MTIIRVGNAIMSINRIRRILIPDDFTRELGINYNDPMKILVDRETMVLRKYNEKNICVFMEIMASNI